MLFAKDWICQPLVISLDISGMHAAVAPEMRPPTQWHARCKVWWCSPSRVRRCLGHVGDEMWRNMMKPVWPLHNVYAFHIALYVYIYIHYTCVWVTVTMVEGHFSIAGVFKHCKAIGPHPKAIIWDHTRQSIKLGVNQANTVVHIHRTGKTDEGNLTCGALFPAVTISFGIQLARSLSLSLSHSLPLSVVFVANFLQTMSYVGGVI